MGEQKVSLIQDTQEMQHFMKMLLQDVRSLEHMIEHDWFEKDVTRIGAEQEMVLVDDRSYRPATLAMEALDIMQDLPWVETELARFNLEINLDPRVFNGNCFSALENETRTKLETIQERLRQLHARVLLTGILPTLRKHHLSMENLTPKTRYLALMEAINEQLNGNEYELKIVGIDELHIKHDSPLLEACNTSFQVHLQVAPADFVKMYNIAQTLTAPVMAIAANSPIVFGKRLWHESRIALFQQALDTRSANHHMRERSARVNFGNDWLRESVVEIYKEDIARFRVLISGDIKEDSKALIEQGITPKLRALQVHNSTVYRWNRPCYGISENGKPHLRIENRVLPAGPTIRDEVANAALWLGAMHGMSLRVDDIRKHISFHDIRDNFGKAAKFGIDSKLNWFEDRKIPTLDLLREELLPMAREGLKHAGVDSGDIDTYLGIIEERSRRGMTGARWMLRAYTRLRDEVPVDEALTVLTACISENQAGEAPVHEWKEADAQDLKEYLPTKLRVSEFMATDLFTVQPSDIIEFVAEMLDWQRIRYIPVEDKKGHLAGLITSRLLLRHYVSSMKRSDVTEHVVGDIMIKTPHTIGPDATITEAMEIMRRNGIGCLPVVQGEELIGIITEMDFLRISSRLLERLRAAEDPNSPGL